MQNRLTNHSLMFTLAVLLVCACCAGNGNAVTNYLDNETLYSNQDPDTETRRSDHFRLCFGHYNRDTGTPMTEKLAQGNLQMFEHLWQRNIIELGLNDMGQSAHLDKRDGNFYKVNFNVLMTWDDRGCVYGGFRFCLGCALLMMDG